LEERLRYILSTVNEWLKFAEAKNGALLAVDAAIIFGIFKLTSDSAWPHAIFSYLTISLVIASAVSCLISYIPKIKNPPTWYKITSRYCLCNKPNDSRIS